MSPGQIVGNASVAGHRLAERVEAGKMLPEARLETRLGHHHISLHVSDTVKDSLRLTKGSTVEAAIEHQSGGPVESGSSHQPPLLTGPPIAGGHGRRSRAARNREVYSAAARAPDCVRWTPSAVSQPGVASV